MASILSKNIKDNTVFLPVRFKRAEHIEELQEFASKNPAIPALDLAYLQQNTSYLLYDKDKIVGGFVYATQAPLRSIEIIKDAELRQACYAKFKGKKVAEITGLWLDKRYRKSLFSKFLWLTIALKTFFGEADYYLFVSKSRGLVKAMNYPACTFNFLTCEERLPGNEQAVGTFFLSEKKHSLQGMLEALYYFAFKPTQKRKEKHGLSHFKIDSPVFKK